MEEFGAQIVALAKNINVFLWARFVPVFLGFFYYKYRSCIRVNHEIEGVETRV